MEIKKEKLYRKEQTSGEMKRVVSEYCTDLNNMYIQYKGKQVSLSELPLNTFFDFVKNIRYRMDKKPVEVLMRPYYAVKYRKKGIDCKKKAILIASYAHCNNIPYRFIASSKRKDKRMHHVFPQLRIKNRWVNADATYNDYSLGQVKTVTDYEEI